MLLIGRGTGVALALGWAAAAGAQTAASVPSQVLVPAPLSADTLLILADHTPIKLMVTREISGNTAKVGDRFKLRVNEAVIVGGVSLIPIGATANGEIVAAAKNGRVASAGSITARLLSVDTPRGPVPLTGTQGSDGDSNTGGLALGIAGFGLLGLLSRGNEGKLKAGAILTGYVDGTFQLDPAAGTLTRITTPTAAPLVVGTK